MYINIDDGIINRTAAHTNAERLSVCIRKSKFQIESFDLCFYKTIATWVIDTLNWTKIPKALLYEQRVTEIMAWTSYNICGPFY